MHFLREYQHPSVNRAYREAKEKLAPVNGQKGIWVAGLYAPPGVNDSHNGAVVSAINVSAGIRSRAVG